MPLKPTVLRGMLMALALAAAVPTLAAGQITGPQSAVVDSSFAAADGARTLQQSLDIDGSAAVLWKAYTDPVEFARWNAPVSAMDLRVGGWLEASYDPRHRIGDPGGIRHRILTYLPERLLVFQNIATPPGFPSPETFQRTVIILQYQPLSAARTRVTLSITGWGTDEASNRLYAFFKAGNAELLVKMKAVYEATR